MPESKGRKPATRPAAKRAARPAAATRRAAARPARKPAAEAHPETAAVATAAPQTRTAARSERTVPAGPSITILQFASGIGCPKPQKRVLRALGLRHPNQRVVRPDHPSVRGMVATIPHLVRIVEERHGA
jgi:large subunit ribosomal protein L30